MDCENSYSIPNDLQLGDQPLRKLKSISTQLQSLVHLRDSETGMPADHDTLKGQARMLPQGSMIFLTWTSSAPG